MIFNQINSLSDLLKDYTSPVKTGGSKSKNTKKKVDEMIFKLIKKFKKDFNMRMKKYNGGFNNEYSLSQSRIILPMGDLTFKNYELQSYNQYEREGF